jgi:NAD(P)-dependent dehydrogenase (short-subunit alcohol dehydrogenase family)
MQLTTDTIAFVTGANRGLGRALVDALLERGARRVYAAARTPGSLEALVASAPERVRPVAFDLADPASIAAAAADAPDLTLLINNAGIAAFAAPLDAAREAVEREMTINYLGTLETIWAFAPTLEHNGGAVVNVLSLLSLASAPAMAGYSASKAAAHSLTQALRPTLAARGVAVHGAYPAGIDTDMVAGIGVPKSPPRVVADGILDGVAAGEEDIFPDPNARQMAATWWSDPKAFERAFAGT